MWRIWGGMGLLLLVGAWLVYVRMMQVIPVIATFEDCAAAGYVVMEKYPPVCRTPDGRTFTQQVASPDTDNLIQVQIPQPGQVVQSPLVITGQARGTWFFEASFPVALHDMEGTVLSNGIATAEGEWMTQDFVPFTATLPIPSNFQGPAILVLQKDNPSGLPEHDNLLRVPVTVGSN